MGWLKGTVHMEAPSNRLLSRFITDPADPQALKGEGGFWARKGAWGAPGRKERNACKDAIVFSIFHAQILSVKIVIGQNWLNVENNITPFN